jgi:hypothetical protein
MVKFISIILIGFGLAAAVVPAALANGGPPNNSCTGDKC